MPWQLYAEFKAADPTYVKPLLTGPGKGVFEIPCNPAERTYFRLEQGGQQYLLAERRLPMGGGYNFRDLGGLPAGAGQRVRWGRLLRADSLCDLTGPDVDYLASVPVAVVVDFRTPAEADKAPDRLPPGARYVHLPVFPGRLDNEKERDALIAGGGAEAFMGKVARSLVEDPEIIAAYRKFFDLVQDDDTPVLFHCSAGKDRTGYAAGLILLALGVSEAVVMQDYLASVDCLRGKYDHLIDQHPAWEPLFTVKPEYMRITLESMKARSGTVEAYLTTILGVDVRRMRKLYLEDNPVSGTTAPEI